MSAVLAVVGVFFGAQSALAAAPPLRSVPWASASFLFSDGSRYAVLGTGPNELNGVVTVDTATGRKIPVAATACPGGGYSRPAAIGAGLLLGWCSEDFGGSQLIMTSVATGETRVAAPPIAAEH